MSEVPLADYLAQWRFDRAEVARLLERFRDAPDAEVVLTLGSESDPRLRRIRAGELRILLSYPDWGK